MSSQRGGFGVSAWVFVIAILGVVLALVPTNSVPPGTAAASAPTHLTENPIPIKYALHPGPPVVPAGAVTVPVPTHGLRSESPADPADPPFRANVPIWTDPRAQTRPSIATDSTGRIFVAFTHESSALDSDVYVTWSDDGGGTWAPPVPVAAGPSNEVNPAIVVTTGDRITIFYEQDGDASRFEYVQSMDRGGTWTKTSIGPLSDLEQFRYPSFAPHGGGAYGMYQTFCTYPGSVCGGGAWTVLMLLLADVTDSGSWRGVYLAQTPDVELFHPATAVNPTNGDLVGAIEIEVADNLRYDLTWFRFNFGSSFFSQDALMCLARCESTQFLWPSIAIDGNRGVVGAQFLNATLGPTPVVLAAYSDDVGAGVWGPSNGAPGRIDGDSVDQGVLSLGHNGTQVLAGYWKGGATWTATSPDGGATFGAPVRVSDNTPPTSAAGPREIAVALSSQGPLVAWQDGRDGDPNIYFSGVPSFVVTVNTNPIGLPVRVDSGTWVASPGSWRFPSGSTHTIEAMNPGPAGPDTRYVFVRWDDSSILNPRAITVTGDLVYTADLRAQYRITLDTNPPALILVLDAVPLSVPVTFWCDEGSVHAVSAPTPQAGGPTGRYRFDRWSDGPTDNPRTITCSAPATYVAIFVPQILITVRATAPGEPSLVIVVDGVTYPSPVSLWLDEGSVHILGAATTQSVSLETRAALTGWAGGPADPVWTVTVAGPAEYVAEYRIQHLFIVDAALGGAEVDVDGVPYTARTAIWWDEGSTHTLTAQAEVPGGAGERWVFLRWGTGSMANPLSVTANAPGSFVAEYVHQYRIELHALPDNGATFRVDGVPYSGPFWADAGDVLAIEAKVVNPGPTGVRHVFRDWADGASSAPGRDLAVTGPWVLTARYDIEYLLTISASHGSPTCENAREVTGDGCWYLAGQTATVTVATSGSSAGVTRKFAGWSGDGTASGERVTVLMDGPKSVTASWREVSFLEEYGLLLAVMGAVGAVAAIVVTLYVTRLRKP